MDTSNVLRQHQEVLSLTSKISSYKNQQQVKENAFEISLLLGQLAGRIKTHLAAEDKFIYPRLMDHPDSQVRMTCEKFPREMGDLAKEFNAYQAKYSGAGKIEADPANFLTDTKDILSALTTRIEKENTSLYPLLA